MSENKFLSYPSKYPLTRDYDFFSNPKFDYFKLDSERAIIHGYVNVVDILGKVLEYLPTHLRPQALTTALDSRDELLSIFDDGAIFDGIRKISIDQDKYYFLSQALKQLGLVILTRPNLERLPTGKSFIADYGITTVLRSVSEEAKYRLRISRLHGGALRRDFIDRSEVPHDLGKWVDFFKKYFKSRWSSEQIFYCMPPGVIVSQTLNEACLRWGQIDKEPNS